MKKYRSQDSRSKRTYTSYFLSENWINCISIFSSFFKLKYYVYMYVKVRLQQMTSFTTRNSYLLTYIDSYVQFFQFCNYFSTDNFQSMHNKYSIFFLFWFYFVRTNIHGSNFIHSTVFFFSVWRRYVVCIPFRSFTLFMLRRALSSVKLSSLSHSSWHFWMKLELVFLGLVFAISKDAPSCI